MLEVDQRDGRARVASWGDRPVKTPTLVWPVTSLAPCPAAIDVVIAREDVPGKSTLRSGGTWFHPEEVKDGLVVGAPEPGPTGEAQVVAVGDELAVFHDAGGHASDPSRLVPLWIDAARQIGQGRLFWAPALGTPDDYALWCYLGADLFDASPLLLAAARGRALTVDGPLEGDGLAVLGEGPWDFERLVAWNVEAALSELRRIRHHIAKGDLRSLVERRVYVRPRSVEILRRFDREHRFLRATAPSHRSVPLPCFTQESLTMPEVRDFRNRFREAYLPPPADTLLLLPCSARKPYRTSQSHRRFIRAIDASGQRHRVHEVMITSPLGLVPRDIEEMYPANSYDVPVTGAWTQDEEEVVRTQLASLLAKNDYKHIVAHVSQATFDALRDLVPDAVHTVLHRPTAFEDLERLTARLAALPGVELGRDTRLVDLRAAASMQFGPQVAQALVQDARVQGRHPFLKLIGPEGQRGMTTAGRGVLSLTPEGARILAQHGKRVFIGDFNPKRTSSLFAVGVTGADEDIRVGDEVAVVHDGELRGCGVAAMSGAEMMALRRGVAVQLRHTCNLPIEVVV